MDESQEKFFRENIYYEHYRVPNYLYFALEEVGANKGKPPFDALFRYRKGMERWQPSCRGGLTVCVLRLQNGASVRGEALCSLSDNFSYKDGRLLSYQRAAQEVDRLLAV